jgi:hypothetical protein
MRTAFGRAVQHQQPRVLASRWWVLGDSLGGQIEVEVCEI